MRNPILQQLNIKQMQQNLNQITRSLKGQNINDVFNNMLYSNPKFKDFVEKSKGKSIDELAMEYDLDADLLKKFL